MSLGNLIVFSLSLGFFSNSFVTIYNIYLFSLSSIFFRKLFIESVIINKIILIFSFIFILSTISYNLYSFSENVSIPITDYLFIFIAIIFSYYLSKENILNLFISYLNKIGIFTWIIYIFFYISQSIQNNAIFFKISIANNAIKNLNDLTYGSFFKPLISFIFVVPLILFFDSNKKLKLNFFIQERNLTIPKIIFILPLILILPSRSIQVGLLVYLAILFLYEKRGYFSIQFIKLISISIPNIFFFFLYNLNNLVDQFPGILFFDRRISVWIEAIKFLKENPSSLFLGVGYSQVGYLVKDNLKDNFELQELRENLLNLIPPDFKNRLLIDSIKNNYILTGFESDFVNGIFAFGLIPLLIISSLLLYKLMKMIFINTNQNPPILEKTYITFAKINFPILISLFFEDRSPYIILWILMFTIISIPSPSFNLKKIYD